MAIINVVSPYGVTEVNAAITAALPGDTVAMPVCDVTWTTSVFVTKDITFQGAGIGQTYIRGGSSTQMLVLGSTATRVTGITFVITVNNSAFQAVTPRGRGFRIDHCHFTNSVSSSALGVYVLASTTGAVATGVIDHCQFNNCRVLARGVVADAFIGLPANVWFAPLALGSSEFVFVEDCTFTHFATNTQNCLDGEYGGRVVFRHNTVVDAPLENHSASPIYRGMRAWEIYENTLTRTGNSVNRPMYILSGSGVIYNNTLIGYTGLISFNNRRTDQNDIFTDGNGVYVEENGAFGGSPLDGNGNPAYGNDTLFRGTHTGSNAAAVLTDGTKTWDVDSFKVIRTDTFSVNASSDIITTVRGHHLIPGYVFRVVSTNTTFPSPLTLGVDYYVVADSLGTSTFKISSTVDGPVLDLGASNGLHYWTCPNRNCEFFVYNETTGAKARIVSNTATTVTGVLTGGTRNNWNTGDVFRITDGYPARDQIGRSTDLWLWTAGTPYPPQTLDPAYIWGNTSNGAETGVGINVNIRRHVVAGRDCFVNVGAKPGYTAYVYPHPLVSGTTAGKIINLSGNLAFGNVYINETLSHVLSITNLGDTTLTVTSITYPSGYTGAFAGTVLPGATQNVTVVFAPIAVATYNGTITVNSDATSGVNTMAVTGAGIARPLGRIISVAGDLTYGNVIVGQTKQRVMIIRNTGDTTLTVASITYPTGFTGNWASGTIPAGTVRPVFVTFSPVATVLYSGNVVINSDADVVLGNVVQASGTGVTAAVVGPPATGTGNATRSILRR